MFAEGADGRSCAGAAEPVIMISESRHWGEAAAQLLSAKMAHLTITGHRWLIPP
jgi:hypothetical protein